MSEGNLKGEVVEALDTLCRSDVPTDEQKELVALLNKKSEREAKEGAVHRLARPPAEEAERLELVGEAPRQVAGDERVRATGGRAVGGGRRERVEKGGRGGRVDCERAEEAEEEEQALSLIHI